jgi:hypothetical protein
MKQITPLIVSTLWDSLIPVVVVRPVRVGH